MEKARREIRLGKAEKLEDRIAPGLVWGSIVLGWETSYFGHAQGAYYAFRYGIGSDEYNKYIADAAGHIVYAFNK